MCPENGCLNGQWVISKGPLVLEEEPRCPRVGHDQGHRTSTDCAPCGFPRASSVWKAVIHPHNLGQEMLVSSFCPWSVLILTDARGMSKHCYSGILFRRWLAKMFTVCHHSGNAQRNSRLHRTDIFHANSAEPCVCSCQATAGSPGVQVGGS